MKKIILTLICIISFASAGIIYTNYQITTEGGTAIYLQNKSGVTLVKGNVVSIWTNGAIKLFTNNLEPIGIVYSTISNNKYGWVVINGMADVLLDTATNNVLPSYYMVASVGNNTGKVHAYSALPVITNSISAFTNYFTNSIVNVVTNNFNVTYLDTLPDTNVNTNTINMVNVFTNNFNYTYETAIGSTASFLQSDDSKLIGYSLIATNNTTTSILCRIVLKFNK